MADGGVSTICDSHRATALRVFSWLADQERTFEADMTVLRDQFLEPVRLRGASGGGVSRCRN
jgi:hypothetical protein